jgi:hypothetical protein
MQPAVSATLLVLAFIGLSYLIFSRISYPEYVYTISGIIALSFTDSSKRIEFMKQCLNAKDYLNIRLIENGLLALPIVCFLIYKDEPILALIFALSAFALLLIPASAKLNRTIPSPFGRFPFEYTRGFRRFFLLYLTCYGITFFAILANNFNLGTFILLLSFLLNATYYSYAEPLHYLWIHHHNPKHFIAHKLRTIIIYSVWPALPIAIALLVFFPSYFWVIPIALSLGILYIVLFMFAKYASYPYEMSITDGLIVSVSIVIPPLLLISIPLFYHRSLKALNPLLRD